jgi:glycosyltransferase involved in cell wall biosynthesis
VLCLARYFFCALILLASVLKPVDDTRMLGKFARTLAALGARVAVAGRGSVASSLPGNISQHPIFWGGRLSLGRLGAQVRYWRLLRQLRPALVVVHAPELLPLTLLWRALGRNRQFIYDIRENYALNVSTQGVYAGLMRRTLASGLRWVEGLAARRAAALTLAEESYAAELPFLRLLPPSRVVVLENKYQPAPTEQLPTTPRPLPAPTKPLRLLYSGTISELNGLRAAVGLAEILHVSWPGGAQLTIIGFCQRPELLAELARWQAQGRPINVLGGTTAVPHAAIVAQISRSHLGMALYEPHPSTWRCRPTKLFEYLAHGLPVVIPENPLWQALISQYDAGLSGDFSPAQLPATAASLLTKLRAQAQNPANGFYRSGLPSEVLWASEGKKLGLLLESLGLGPTFAAPFA